MALISNLTIDQGTDFEAVVTLYSTNTANLDLTNYTAVAQLRKSYDSVTSSGTFAVSIPIPTNGEIYLSMAAASSSALRYGRYVYDVLLTDTITGKKSRAVEGIVTVMPNVTR